MGRKKQREKPRYNTPLLLLLLALVPLYGGYYPFSILLCGALLIPLTLYEARRAGGLRIPVGVEAWCLYALCVCHLLSIPFAVSRGMAFIGFLRAVVWILFFLCANAYSQEERGLMLDAVAWEGTVLSAVFTLLFLADRAMGTVDLNGRIDGPFQYANTWALFQLICLLLLAMGKKRGAAEWIAMAVLLCGIGLTASRGVLLLLPPLAAAGVARHLLRKGRLQPLLYAAIPLTAAVVAAGFLSGGLLWKRLLAIPASSSLNGRLLYDLDGLRMLWKHPFGIGRGGYFYLQTLEQTGVYTLRFIHNEYLQFALDAGVLAGILSVALMITLLFRRPVPDRERVVIFVIALHACVDFDFQFPVMMCLLLLCGAGGKNVLLPRWTADRVALRVAGGLLSLCFVYFSAVYGLDFAGRIAWRWFPADLELAEKRLQSFPSPEAAEKMAGQILRSTDLSMLAWDCEYQAASRRGDLPVMAEAKYRYLRLNRYRGEVYEDFVSLLESASVQAPENAEMWRTLAEKARAQLEEMAAHTSPLAWRIADKPELDFTEEVSARLEQIIEEG